MMLTAIVSACLLQENTSTFGAPGLIFGPDQNPQIARVQNSYTPSGLKLIDYSINQDERVWIGLTAEGVIVGSNPEGISIAVPSHLRFSAFCGTPQKGGGITTSGEVYWWFWNDDDQFFNGFTNTRFTQIACCDNYGHLVGLREDGVIEYIGYEELISNLPTVPEGTYKYITSGVAYPWYAAIGTNETLRAWGEPSQELTFDGQQVDWTAMCVHSGYELLGLKPDGTTESTN